MQVFCVLTQNTTAVDPVMPTVFQSAPGHVAGRYTTRNPSSHPPRVSIRSRPRRREIRGPLSRIRATRCFNPLPATSPGDTPHLWRVCRSEAFQSAPGHVAGRYGLPASDDRRGRVSIRSRPRRREILSGAFVPSMASCVSIRSRPRRREILPPSRHTTARGRFQSAPGHVAGRYCDQPCCLCGLCVSIRSRPRRREIRGRKYDSEGWLCFNPLPATSPGDTRIALRALTLS